MKKYLILFLLISCYTESVIAQISYLKKYTNGDLPNETEVVKIIRAINNDEILIFSTAKFESSDSWYLATRKINSGTGEVLLFNKYYPELNHGITPSHAIRNSLNNFVLTGIIGDDNIASFSEGNIFLCELNENAEILWSQILGVNNLREWGKGVVQTLDGGYIVSGWKERNTTENISDGFIIKTNAEGEEQWMRTIQGSLVSARGRQVEIDNDGNIYFLWDDYALASTQQIGLTKFTSEGDPLWTKYYPINGITTAKGIHRAENGNIVLFGDGKFQISGTAFLMELDTEGEIIWIQDYLSESAMWATSSKKTNEGGYVICGENLDNPIIIVTDEEGNAIWSQIYDSLGISAPRDITQLNDGSYMLTGYINPLPGDDSHTVWLLKTDNLGNIVITSGIELLSPKIKIYPNPTRDQIQIEIINENLNSYSARLVNNAGIAVREYQTIDLQTSLSIANLPSGIYYLNIFKDKKLVAVEKIIKQ